MATRMGKYLCSFDPTNPRSTKEGYVYTHVLIVEKKLGRLLKPEEVVHHLDEDKFNNDPENLVVFKTNADHAAFHKGCEAILDGDVYWCPGKRESLKCPICGKEKSNKSIMCYECRQLYNEERNQKIRLEKINKKLSNRALDDDFRIKLKNDIRYNSFLSLAKQYEVTDNAIRKWCVKYGLPSKTHIINLIPDDEWDSENLSQETINKINDYYIAKVASDNEIINYYFRDPCITRVVGKFYKDADTIKNILQTNNIRLLTASEVSNIKITDVYKNNIKVNSFLTTMNAAQWILDNNYNGNVHIVKNISYAIQKALDKNVEKFGFTYKENKCIYNYEDYLKLNKNIDLEESVAS